MTRTTSLAALAAGLGLALAGLACGQNLQATDAAQVRLDAPEGGVGVDLGELCPAQKQGPPGIIRLESTGKKPLKITKLEIENLPNRVLYRGEETETTCEYDASKIGAPWNDASGNCGQNQYCDSTGKTCVSTTPPSTPIKIETDSTEEFRFFHAAAFADGPDAELDCPEAPEGTPEAMKEDYCGHVKIETNAATNNSVFNDGNATFYFQMKSDRRGVLKILNNSLKFEGLKAGSKSKKKTFSVQNNSSGQQLTISNLTVQKQSNLVKVSPKSTPITIDPGKSREFDVQVDLSTLSDISKLEDFDQVNIESSAVNNCSSVPVNLTLNAAGTGGPAILLDADSLSFHNSKKQKIEVRNTGDEQLLLNKATFRPMNLSNKYKVRYLKPKSNGNGTKPVKLMGNNTKVQPGETETLTVEFTGSSGGIGVMRLFHNDGSIGDLSKDTGLSKVILLGGQNRAYASIQPPEVNFAFGENSTYTYHVWNRGSDPLELSPTVSKSGPVGPSNFTFGGILNNSKSVGPGSVATGTIQFDGASGNQDVQTEIQLNVKNNGAGTKTMTLEVEKSSQSSNLKAKIKKAADTVEVGELATFNSSPSQGNSNAGNDYWYLVDRPDKSAAFPTSSGPEFSFRPDVAGTYTIGLTVVEGGAQSQNTAKLTVNQPSGK